MTTDDDTFTVTEHPDGTYTIDVPVDDDGAPDPLWADRRLVDLARLDADHARDVAPFDHELEVIAARRDDLVAGYTATRERIVHALRSWHALVRAADPKRKTVHLPHGDLSSSAAQNTLTITDTVAAAWATANLPALLVPPPEPRVSLSAVRDAIKAGTLNATDGGKVVVAATGEVVDGVTWSTGGDTGDGYHWRQRPAPML